jgi:hypothetical protein
MVSGADVLQALLIQALAYAFLIAAVGVWGFGRGGSRSANAMNRLICILLGRAGATVLSASGLLHKRLLFMRQEDGLNLAAPPLEKRPAAGRLRPQWRWAGSGVFLADFLWLRASAPGRGRPVFWNWLHWRIGLPSSNRAAAPSGLPSLEYVPIH